MENVFLVSSQMALARLFNETWLKRRSLPHASAATRSVEPLPASLLNLSLIGPQERDELKAHLITFQVGVKVRWMLHAHIKQIAAFPSKNK